MRKYFAIGACVLALAGATCTPQEQMMVGGLVGAGVGVGLADLMNANTGWTVVAAMAGAAVGSQVAYNAQTNQCAYKRADGRVEVRPC
ncbi:hypothetical protein [Nioella nitratireducens]|uniref:hypothetical protein n=1 Tax=Nioella nitratireducens TaxID=1287720 RepID=UPI0008FCF9A9|nr:hypothetical protein [Nioella nitratireducens]